ncbi:MAG: transposase [bacterium]|nr:transposase [bacterium]
MRQQHADLLHAFFLACCDQHRDAKHEKTRALARELLNDWDTFWVVLDYPWLPLTNNEAYAARGISLVMPRPGLCRVGKRLAFPG